MSFESVAARAAQDLRASVGTAEHLSPDTLARTHRRRRTAGSAAVGLILTLLAMSSLALVQRGDEQPPPADGVVRNGTLVGMVERTVYAVDGETPSLPPDIASESLLQVAPDGRLIYTTARGWVVSRDLHTGREHMLARCPTRDYCPAVLSSDGRTLALPSPSGTVWVDVRTGAQRPYPFRPDGAMTWSPDARRLAVLTHAGLWVVDVADGSSTRVVRLGKGHEPPGVPLWAPDGRSIAFMDGRRISDAAVRFTVVTVRPDGTDVRRVVPAGACFCAGIPTPTFTWSPDGRRLAVSIAGRGTMTFRPDGTDPHFSGAQVWALVWLPRSAR